MTDTRDFTAFYAATFPGLCAALSVHTGDLAEAQDVVQEAFIRAYTRWHTIHAYDDDHDDHRVGRVGRLAYHDLTIRHQRCPRSAP